MDNTIFIDLNQNKNITLEDLDYDSFIIIKPGFLNYTNEIIEDLRQHGYEIVKAEEKTLTKSEAEKLYQMHKKKSFFNELIDYMTDGPSLGIILKSNHANRDVAIDNLLMIKEKYRQRYGTDVMRNVLHGSDSYNNLIKESKAYFNN